jgi:hypothetical protein
MAKGKNRGVFPSPDQPPPHRAILFELKCERNAEDGTAPTALTEMVAALSLEELIADARRRHPDMEIIELKVVGKVQVLSSSEHL